MVLARPVTGTTILESRTLNRFHKLGLKIGILHAGGPAPGGNLVVFAAGLRAKDHGIPLVGLRHGYESLISGDPQQAETLNIGLPELRAAREQAALLIGTARVNPGKQIFSKADLKEPSKTKQLRAVLDTFEALRIGALVSIGGDDTGRTAALMQMFVNQERKAGTTKDVFRGVVHVPKTIDNDYPGISFTFGFLSAAESIGRRIQGFHEDAKATGRRDKPVYHLVELMGRGSGWLAAASSIFGQSTLTVVPEDYEKGTITLEELAQHIVAMILTRRNQGKHYGVITVAEGIGEMLPKAIVGTAGLDEHGHMKLDAIGIVDKLEKEVGRMLRERGIDISLHTAKEGYSHRQVSPGSYDTILCQSLGVAAIDAILGGKFGRMVTVTGCFETKTLALADLMDPQTLRFRSRPMTTESGLYRLLRALETPFDGLDKFNR